MYALCMHNLEDLVRNANEAVLARETAGGTLVAAGTHGARGREIALFSLSNGSPLNDLIPSPCSQRSGSHTVERLQKSQWS